MPVVEQEIHAMLFQLNWKRRALRHFLYDLDFADAHFESAGCALFRADFSRRNDARFLRQPFQCFKRFRALFQRAHALDNSSSIAENRKDQLAGLAQIVEPALDRHLLPVVFSRLFNRDRRHCALRCKSGLRRVYSNLLGYRAWAIFCESATGRSTRYNVRPEGTMSNSSQSRRDFIATTSIGLIGAAAIPSERAPTQNPSEPTAGAPPA